MEIAYTALFLLAPVVISLIIAVLKRPILGAYLWAALLPIQLDTLHLLGFKLAPADTLLPFIVLALMALGTKQKISLPKISYMPYLIALVFIFGISTLVTSWHLGFIPRYTLINKDVGLLALLASFFVLIILLRDKWQVYSLMRWVLLSAFAVNVISLLGYTAELFLGWQTPFLEFEQRLTGLLLDPNAYGGYLDVMFLLQIPLLLDKRNLLPKWLMWLNVILLLLGILLTFSRSAWIGLAIGALVLLWFYKIRFGIRIVTASASVVTLVFLIFGTEFVDPIVALASRQEQIVARWGYIQKGLSYWANNPLLGIGIGAFPQLDPSKAIIHNTYIWLLVETGIIGFLVFIALIYRGVRNFLISVKLLYEDRNLAIGAFAGFVAMLGFAIGIEMLYQRHFWLLMALSEILYRWGSLSANDRNK